MVLTLMATRLDIALTGCEHVPGINNVICDNLSRKYTVAEACSEGTPDLFETLLGSKVMVNKLIQLCDPLIGVDEKEGDHEAWWAMANLFMLGFDQLKN